MSKMAARQSLISTWRWALETFGEFLASRPALVRRLVVNALVLMAGVLLMLARTSPALAADNSHGQGKSQDRTSASAVAQRHDSPTHQSDHQIGGSGDGDKSKTKSGATTLAPKASSPAPKPATSSAPPVAPEPKDAVTTVAVKSSGNSNGSAAVVVKTSDKATVAVKANGNSKGDVKANDKATVAVKANGNSKGDVKAG